MAVAKTGGQIVLDPINVEDVVIHIEGTSPLIVHKFGQKALLQILGEQMGGEVVRRKVRKAKYPIGDFLEAAHIMPAEGEWSGTPQIIWWNDPDGEHENGEIVDPEELPSIVDGVAAVGRFGFPAVAFKAAAVRAAKSLGAVMTDVRLAFYIPTTLVEIHCIDTPGPIMRMDMVRVSNGNPDVRFRPEFPRWKAAIPVQLHTRSMNLESLLSMFKSAGFSVGVGEWRGEKEGTNGLFRVVGVDRLGESKL